MIHAKMTKPRKVAPKAIKTTPATKTASKTTPKKTPQIDLVACVQGGVITIANRSGRLSAERPNKANTLRSSAVTMPPVGTIVEVLIDYQWWPGTIFVSSELARVDLFVGAPYNTAVIYRGGLDVSWRPANRLHSVPLTRQGVRNLDMAAPPRFRNGRRFRKPKHFEAIFEGLDEDRRLFTYVLRFRECGDCGAEISI